MTGNKPIKWWQHVVGIVFITIAFIALAVSLHGCSVCRSKQLQQTVIRDSTVLHIKDSTVIHEKEVLVPVPVEVMRGIVPGEDDSHLETSLARSDAYIDSLGFLHHSLENKPGNFHATVPVEEHFHEEVAAETHAETEYVTVEVEKPLSWSQRMRLSLFTWIVLAALLLALLALRRPLGRILCRLFH